MAPTSSGVGRKGLDTSNFLGYTSTATGEGFSWAMEGYVNDYGIAQTEFAQAVEDVRRGTAEPVKATESTVAQVRQKISQLEGGMGDIVSRVKGTVGQ